MSTDHGTNDYGAKYTSANLPTSLNQLDELECKIFKTEFNPSKQYRKIEKLSIECLKWYAFCDLTPEQKAQVDERNRRYRAIMDGIESKLTEKARRKANNPFVTVMFDELGQIVDDPEAIIANSILLQRTFFY